MNDKVTFIEGGPAIVATEDGKKVAICRCGKSADAKFCDGTHAKK